MPNSPSQIITLPTQIQATSATDTSTGPVPFWDVSDATALSFTISSVTTAAAGTFAEVCYNVGPSTGPFFKLNYPSFPSSAAALIVPTSSFIVHFSPVTFKQIRFGTATVVATTYLYTGAKLVTI